MNNKALLVGINNYPSEGNDLRGCVNDVLDMAQFIGVKNSKYDITNIKTVLDHRATKKGILDALQWLINGASSGDQLLFHYSGHGAQIPSQGPLHEKDGLDEIICPYDFNQDPQTAIRDKEFAKIFATIPQDVHFVWISDSCHSADLSRKPDPIAHPTQVTRFRRFKSADTTNPIIQPITSMGTTISPLHGALLSGCASHQLSADAYINNRFNGAFTHYLIKNLSMYGQDVSMQEIVKYVNIDLMDNGYEQNPQSEGLLATQKFFQ